MTIHFQSTDAVAGAAIEHLEDEQNVPLSGHIKSMLEGYFNDLDGHPPADLYQMVLQEIEQPLLESVLHYTRGNQSKAAIVLGLNRGTLRKKLKQYDLN
ncbi:MAG: DNA-binding transcriptional regulator Fis [Ectothiorhodospiraceae bacterium]|nr:DNA-binding transcriptional regulator Fis [Ectothiorhodospiraceae bacterium]